MKKKTFAQRAKKYLNTSECVLQVQFTKCKSNHVDASID